MTYEMTPAEAAGFKVGDRVRAVTDGGFQGLKPGTEGTVTDVNADGNWVHFPEFKTFAIYMYDKEIELVSQEIGRRKYRASIANEVLAYADSIDEFTTKDDIYAGLLDLATEIRKGDWG